MRPLPFDIPPELAAQAALGPRWADWLHRLPRLVADLVEEWGLDYDGSPRHGFASLVVPVAGSTGTGPISTGTGPISTSGRPISTGTGPISTGRGMVLKVSFDGDTESVHEALALQHWQGNGTVRLMRAEPRRRALLLERLDERDLRSVGDLEACAVIAGLYERLHVAALPQLTPLASFVQTWNDGLRSLGTEVPMPRRLVEQAVHLADGLVADPAIGGALIHGDLHYENVLGADREPWLAIDPKPMAGDPHYEVAPVLWNRWDEAVGSGNVREAVRRRFHTVVDTAGLDEDRAREWVIVRAVHNASWTVDEASSRGRDLGQQDREWLTRMVAVAKAVQD